MNRHERELRRLLRDHPAVVLVSGRHGYSLVVAGRRRSLGPLTGTRDLREIEDWCREHETILLAASHEERAG
jgi:hypothetical protein